MRILLQLPRSKWTTLSGNLLFKAYRGLPVAPLAVKNGNLGFPHSQVQNVFTFSCSLQHHHNFLLPGEGTSYVGQYGMLGYHGLFLRNFLYFFSDMGTFFQQNFCIFSARWVSILKKNSVFVEQDGTHLQEIFCILFHKVSAFYT